MREYESSADTGISPAIPLQAAASFPAPAVLDETQLAYGKPWAGCRLLWVDDSSMLLSLYKAVFEKLGFEVLATSSPAQALRHLSFGEADIAILDYDMPAMNGENLASLIKDRSPRFPVILYSGNTSLPSSTHRQVDAICAKGGPRQDLLDAIERLAFKATVHVPESPPSFTPSSNH
jgi:CheY-like chemotaxis protein